MECTGEHGALLTAPLTFANLGKDRVTKMEFGGEHISPPTDTVGGLNQFTSVFDKSFGWEHNGEDTFPIATKLRVSSTPVPVHVCDAH